MAFKFDKLWQVLQERNISKEQLRVAIRASQTTIVKMGANGNVSLEVIDKICNFLGCSANDIMEHILDEDSSIKERGHITKGSIYLHTRTRDEIEKNDYSQARPVLVLQSTDMCKGANSIFVAPILLRTQPAFPYGIIVNPTISNGLKALDDVDGACFVVLTQIRQLPATLLRKKIGELQSEQVIQVDEAMKTIFGLF